MTAVTCKDLQKLLLHLSQYHVPASTNVADHVCTRLSNFTPTSASSSSPPPTHPIQLANCGGRVPRVDKHIQVGTHTTNTHTSNVPPPTHPIQLANGSGRVLRVDKHIQVGTHTTNTHIQAMSLLPLTPSNWPTAVAGSQGLTRAASRSSMGLLAGSTFCTRLTRAGVR